MVPVGFMFKGTDTLESFFSKVASESNLRKKLSRIQRSNGASLFPKKKHCESFHDTQARFLSKVTLDRKLYSVSLPLVLKGSDTLESFLSKVTVKKNLHVCHENFRNFFYFERNFHD